MLKRALFSSVVIVSLCLLADAPSVWAQDQGDTIIDTIRVRDTISDADQGRIGRWVSDQIDRLATPGGGGLQTRLATFRDVLRSQYNDARNTPEFRLQLAARTAAAAVERFGQADLDAVVAHALAQVLLDMARIETLSGLEAGLKSGVPVARLLCARGLGGLKAAIANDKPTQDAVIVALREAGKKETSPVVLSRIYLALAYSGQAADVLPAYLDILDRRLAYRRGPAVVADGAEGEALELFRTSGVIGSLNPAQRSELAQRLAVFMRLDAERYASDEIAPPADPKAGDLGFYERDALERMLVATEAVMIMLVPGQSDTITSELRAGGYAQRAQVLARAYQWVGNPTGNVPGILTPAPWNVPIGAP